MVSETPVPPDLLAQLLETSTDAVEGLCAELAAGYDADGRGFVLARVAGGYRYQSHPDLAPFIERFVVEGQSPRLSAAALETLAIVAYKQPVSRAQVSAVRGVNVDAVMRTLQQRGYVVEVGKDSGPGQAVLYGTTVVFLERLGLDSLADLPSLGEFVPGGDVLEALERGLRPGDDAAADPQDHTGQLDLRRLDGHTKDVDLRRTDDHRDDHTDDHTQDADPRRKDGATGNDPESAIDLRAVGPDGTGA